MSGSSMLHDKKFSYGASHQQPDGGTHLAGVMYFEFDSCYTTSEIYRTER